MDVLYICKVPSTVHIMYRSINVVNHVFSVGITMKGQILGTIKINRRNTLSSIWWPNTIHRIIIIKLLHHHRLGGHVSHKYSRDRYWWMVIHIKIIIHIIRSDGGWHPRIHH